MRPQRLYINVDHVATIREAFREIDGDFDGIENVPMRGFRWVVPAATAVPAASAGSAAAAAASGPPKGRR